MDEAIKLLLVEDSEDDAALVLRYLRRGGFQVAYARIQSAVEMSQALGNEAWDIIIADYQLPAFSAPAALELLQASGRDIPFVVASGTIGELAAVAMMRAGAGDYVMKDNLERLSEVVRREIREAKVRAERRQAELERQSAITALERINQELESIVSQRTAELRESNTRLEATNLELARATRLKDEFLANMSHELRTPLNAILGLSEALQDNTYGLLDERQARALATIERSGRHLLALINDILDLAKIASGKVALERELSPIGVLCESSMIFVLEQASQKQIVAATSIPDELRPLLVVVDERRVRQALINLLANAVKFTPEGGSVRLEVELAPGPWLRFHVVDTGIGIAKEELGRLFQPFVQIDSSLSRRSSGTGLGLALVKQIAELHGGRVTVASSLGAGSRFTLELPFEAPAVEAARPPSSIFPADEQQAAAGAGGLILLAEDNEPNRTMLGTYLEAQGYRLITACDGVEAVALAREQRPDLILMDVRMPNLDGLEAMRQIRAEAALAQTPIIALTAFAMASDKASCLEAGATSYIAKPLKLRELLAMMRRLLEAPRQVA